MRKLIPAMLLGFGILISYSGPTWAANKTGGDHSKKQDPGHPDQSESANVQAKDSSNRTKASGKAVDAGNKNCPVMNTPINEKTKATYEYKGKVYNFCCAVCIDQFFKKDPVKYIQKIEKEKENK